MTETDGLVARERGFAHGGWDSGEPAGAAGMGRQGLWRGRPDRSPDSALLTSQCLIDVLDALDSGAIVTDVSSRLLWANEAARRELRAAEVLHCSSDGVLDVGSLAGSAMLRGALLAAVGGRRQLLPLRTADRLLMVAVQPLGTAPSASPRALLLLGRRQLAPDLLVEMLSQQYDLTAAERRVLVGLLGGRRVSALAREHGVKLSTVRTQVAAIREKFGVRRLDDITRMVAEMPPMASALRTGGLG